jgi:hypothetical protein
VSAAVPHRSPSLSRFFLAVAFFHAIRNACLKRPPKVGGNSIRKKDERLWDFRTVQGVAHTKMELCRPEPIDLMTGRWSYCEIGRAYKRQIQNSLAYLQ